MADKLVRTSVVISFFLLMALFSGCGPHHTRLTALDNGSQVTLEPGEILVIELESNPTTGYGWQVQENEGSILSLESEPEYQPDKNAQGMVGAGGSQIFRFTATAAGETTLTLGYVRPWEESVPPLKTFTIRVIIE